MRINDQEQRIFWEHDHGYRNHDHKVIKFFAQQRINFLSQYVDFSDIQSALDVGCGIGVFAYYLPPIPSVIGIDISRLMLSTSPLPRNKLVQGSVSHLPFSNESFDLVGSWDVLHHIENPLPAIQEMSRVSKRWVVLFEPNRYNPGQIICALTEELSQWGLRYSLSYMKKMVDQVNLKIVKSAVVGCIFPHMTPVPIFQLLKYVPFEIPFFGISNVLICEKK